MLDYKDILLKRYALNMSGREIAAMCGVSKSGVNDFLRAFESCDAIGYPLPEGITNYAIFEIVYGKAPGANSRTSATSFPTTRRSPSSSPRDRT